MMIKSLDERDVVGDIDTKEIIKVVVEEDSMVTTYIVGREEARWTEISTIGGEVATIT